MQRSIKDILALSVIPRVLPEDLERFKREFRTSAFTCRFPNCPRATLGFRDEKAQVEHETRHTQRFICDIAGCQYPPFVSDRALRGHVTKCHQPKNEARRNIRRKPGENLPLGSSMQKRPDVESWQVLPYTPDLTHTPPGLWSLNLSPPFSPGPLPIMVPPIGRDLAEGPEVSLPPHPTAHSTTGFTQDNFFMPENIPNRMGSPTFQAILTTEEGQVHDPADQHVAGFGDSLGYEVSAAGIVKVPSQAWGEALELLKRLGELP